MNYHLLYALGSFLKITLYADEEIIIFATLLTITLEWAAIFPIEYVYSFSVIYLLRQNPPLKLAAYDPFSCICKDCFIGTAKYYD